jgi:hypothetical protein
MGNRNVVAAMIHFSVYWERIITDMCRNIKISECLTLPSDPNTTIIPVA